MTKMYVSRAFRGWELPIEIAVSLNCEDCGAPG